MKTSKFLCLALFLFCFSACPITQKKTPAPCVDHSECFPGFECRANRCLACDQVCQERPGEGVGPRGASVCGADNVCMHFAPNTFVNPQTIAIQRIAETASIPDIKVLSGVYTVLPDGLMLDLEATIEIPITSSTANDQFTALQLAVYRADELGGPWTKLTGTSTTITAVGKTDRLGLFTAGVFEE